MSNVESDIAFLLQQHNAERFQQKQSMGEDEKHESMVVNGEEGANDVLQNIRFDVQHQSKTTKLRKAFCGDDTVHDLLQAIEDEMTGVQTDTSNRSGDKKLVSAVYNSIILKDSDQKLSTLAKIRGNGAANPPVHVVINVIGGSYDASNEKTDAMKDMKHDRKRMANFTNKNIKPTLKEDCLFGYNEKNRLRVEMPCGHVFDANTIYELAKMNISNLSRSKIKCPIEKCQKIWELDTVQAAADLDETEYINFKGILSLRELVDSGNYRQCKNCKSLVTKPENIKIFRVRCSQSSCKGQSDFCWFCRKTWVGGGFSVCGNQGCPLDEINTYLQKCDTITPYFPDLGKIECPAVRICPRCLTLNGFHTSDACKHIKCWGCSKEFCFICLSLKKDDGSWECGGAYTKCTLKPRQSLK